jgi:ABC-type uncharacterized transport system substrate-binding protein
MATTARFRRSGPRRSGTRRRRLKCYARRDFRPPGRTMLLSVDSGHRVMERRTFLGVIAGGLLAAPFAAEAQQSQKIRRIGYLSGSAFEASPEIHQAFREGLRELGWIEGQNILVEERYAHGQYDKLPALSAELVKLNVQVIVATSTPEIRAAKQATSTIPIVMVIGADPEAEGFIENVRRPGGNITGTAFAPDPAIAGKYIEFLRDVVPGLRRVGQLVDRGQPDIIYRNAFAQAALKLGLTVFRSRRCRWRDHEQSMGPPVHPLALVGVVAASRPLDDVVDALLRG